MLMFWVQNADIAVSGMYQAFGSPVFFVYQARCSAGRPFEIEILSVEGMIMMVMQHIRGIRRPNSNSSSQCVSSGFTDIIIVSSRATTGRTIAGQRTWHFICSSASGL